MNRHEAVQIAGVDGAERRVKNGPQAQKSASTRTAIVEAAIQCIVKYGYAKTTTPRIAEEAGLSRGAMMHHFSNRLTVIQSAITHLHEKRIKAFRRAGSNLPPAGSNRVHDALIAYWKQVTHPLFVAFHELTVAARTDKGLADILLPARRAFHQEWYRVAVEQFPEWQGDSKKFNIALHLTQNMLEGMAINRLSGDLDEDTAEKLLAYLEEELKALSPATRLNAVQE